MFGAIVKAQATTAMSVTGRLAPQHVSTCSGSILPAVHLDLIVDPSEKMQQACLVAPDEMPVP